MKNAKPVEYVLGVDLGVLSLGWAALELQGGQPSGLLDAGVRGWELLETAETDIEQGKETPPGQARREARQIRRQLFRRGQRLRRAYRVLQELGLFPPGSRNAQKRKQFLEDLDQQAKQWLRQNLWSNGEPPLWEHTWIYHLRAAALDHPLPAPLLGRVFFHLAQRRGFEPSSRIAQRGSGRAEKNKADQEDQGKVKEAISKLAQAMQAAGARTLGEYLAALDPHQERIRGRWTSRRMYLDEFEALWAAQGRFHPQLDDHAKRKLSKALFFQRPLKPQKGLIGRCSLETRPVPAPDGSSCTIYPYRRAPMASLEAQRIRYVQRINDLEFTDPQGKVRVLSDEERSRLYQLAETHEDLSFAAIRKALGIPTGKKGQDWKCNLEAGGETKLPGNRTSARLRRILGDDAWERLGSQKQKELVDTLIGFLNENALQRHLQTKWGFPPETASPLAQVSLEPGYHSFCRRAIRKLLPLLSQGMRLNEAIKEVYPREESNTSASMDFLPPVRRVLPTLNNPLVIRALTELRKVVNALIRRFGKPASIRVELARDLKRPRKQREEWSKRMREQEARRRKAAQRIQDQFHREPKPAEILKVLLAEECNWKCPYTGRPISLEALLGPEPQFDVEHIWPYPRSLDDSFANKTLCYHEENRSRKRDRTPYEAYGADPVRWAQIIDRVKKFQGPFAREKLRRFLRQDLPEDFPERHLSDTRWITRSAADYLGYLYGGRQDPTGKVRVFTTTGALTFLLRRIWDLDRILGPGNEKVRTDHRQHAIDAVVIALTDSGVVQRVSWAAARGLSVRLTPQFDPPWPDFFQQVRDRILSLVVSFRTKRRVSGPLHDQTYYAPPLPAEPEPRKKRPSKHAEAETVADFGQPQQAVRTKVRKRLDQLSPAALEDIVDDRVRELVEAKLAQLGQSDPKKAFASPENLPYIRGRDGRLIPIKSTRVWVSAALMEIGRGHRRRFVIPGNNHHVEIFAHLDAQGNEIRWDGRVVSLFEAVQRVRNKQPVVCRDHGPNTRFKFSLVKGDYIEWTTEDGQKQLLRVIGISHNNLEFRLPYDARPITLIRERKERIRASYTKLYERQARKVAVSPLGEIFPAHD